MTINKKTQDNILWAVLSIVAVIVYTFDCLIPQFEVIIQAEKLSTVFFSIFEMIFWFFICVLVIYICHVLFQHIKTIFMLCFIVGVMIATSSCERRSGRIPAPTYSYIYKYTIDKDTLFLSDFPLKIVGTQTTTGDIMYTLYKSDGTPAKGISLVGDRMIDRVFVLKSNGTDLNSLITRLVREHETYKSKFEKSTFEF